MKQSKLPIYVLIAVIALAIVYAIANPPAPQLAGPLGKFPLWKSSATRGDMTAQAVSPEGTMWAGAWTDKTKDKEDTAVTIIDLNGFTAKTVDLGKNGSVSTLSWADEKTLRAVCVGHDGKAELVSVDAENGKKSHSAPIETQGIVGWPAGSGNMLSLQGEAGKLAVLSEAGKVVGSEVSAELPKDATMDTAMGVAADGSSFVFSVTDPAANDGKSFFVGDTKTGTAKKAFDLGDLPGRIEGIYPSATGLLMVCKVKDKMQNAVWNPATGKIEAQSGEIDLAKYPGAPKSIAFTTYNGGFEFDLATGKTKTLFDTSKNTSAKDQYWREMLRDSRLYKLTSGNYVAVSETGNTVDIREVKSDGSELRALLSRI